VEGGPVRVALLSYRSKPHCGGQGVYVRHLSRELARSGHQVEVFSGQPYPDLDDGVRLTEVPSLDLYREPDPFRTPRLHEYRDLVDLQEVATMWTAGFPEPRTFSRRVVKVLRERAGDFDVVHDNQTLGSALLGLEDACGLPLVASIHHPVSIDRRIDLQSALTWQRRLSLRRWYGFVRMQARVARNLRLVITPSESSKRDVVREFGVDPARTRVVLLGVDDGFVPPTGPRVPGRILAMASADAPLKGIATLLEAAHRAAAARARARLEAGSGRAHRQTSGRAGRPRPRALRARRRGRRARRADGVRRGGLRAQPVRGVLPADRRADGHGDPAGRLAYGRHPRGGRAGRTLRRPGQTR
jgi:glycosyltransferase involved in cell wall biosynthesis